MNNYLINNNKNWIDIIIDGKGGLNDNNLLLCKFLNINIVNFKDSKDELLSIIYYDDNLLQIKSIIGNEFNIDSSIITTVNSPIIDLIAFTDSNKNYTLFYYDTTTLYYISQKFKINTQILLSNIDPSYEIGNVSLKKYIEFDNYLFILSIGSKIYNLLIDNSIAYNLILDNYDGQYIYPFIYNNNKFITYTSNNIISIINLSYSFYINKTCNFKIISNQIRPSFYFSNYNNSSISSFYLSNNQNIPISISFWFSIMSQDDMSLKHSLLGLIDTLFINNGLDINTYNGCISVNITTKDQTYNIKSDENLFEANKLNHCCLTIDSNFETNLYLNNTLIGSININDNIINYSNFIVGGYNKLTGGFKGCINDLMIFNTSLSISDINNIYNLSNNDFSNRIIYIPMNNIYDVNNKYSLYGILNNPKNTFIKPKLIGIDNQLQLLVINDANNNLYTTTINNLKISLYTKIIQCDDFTPIIINNNIYIYCLLDSKVSEIILNQNIVKYKNQINNNYLIKNYDVSYINFSKYIIYICNKKKIHLLKETSNLYKITTNYLINNIQISNNLLNYSNLRNDYCIYINNLDQELTITINEEENITDIFFTNQLIQVTDNINSYYIKIIPNDLSLDSSDELESGLYCIIDDSYYIIHDENYVPIWYHKYKLNESIINSIKNLTHEYFFYPGDSITNVYIKNFYPKTILNITTLEKYDFVLLNDTKNKYKNFDLYNAIKLNNNILIPSNDNIFYLQIQDIKNNIIWEFFGDKHFNKNISKLNISALVFNKNNSTIILSFKNYNSMICIDYNSKKIIWIYDPLDIIIKYLKNPNNIKILLGSNLPNGQYVNYIPITNIQDIDISDDIISVYENELQYDRSRGEAFKIDLDNNQLVWIKQCYSLNSTINFNNNVYKIEKNTNNPFSKCLNWLNTCPSFVEYYSTLSNNDSISYFEPNKSSQVMNILRMNSGLISNL